MTFTGCGDATKHCCGDRKHQSTWTGTFDGINIKTTVVQGTSALDSTVTNSVGVTSGNTSRVSPTSGEHGHSFMSGNGGEVTTKDITGVAIAKPNGTQTTGAKGREYVCSRGWPLYGG